MNNVLTKLTVNVLTPIVLSGAILLGVDNQAQAVTFNYSFLTNQGYSGNGQFSYNGNPAVINESGSGPTNSLQSLSLSVFDPSNNLLDSGNSVINGVSNNSFLLFQFNPLTETLTLLDTNTANSGQDPYYFISNAVDPSNTPVPPGSTTFNLFAFSPSTNGTTFLGSTSSIQVSRVPESTSILSLLMLGGLGLGSVMAKKNSTKHKSKVI